VAPGQSESLVHAAPLFEQNFVQSAFEEQGMVWVVEPMTLRSFQHVRAWVVSVLLPWKVDCWIVSDAPALMLSAFSQ